MATATELTTLDSRFYKPADAFFGAHHDLGLTYDDVTLATLFESLPARIRPEKTEGWTSRFHFLFTGSETPDWTVAIDGAACEVSRGLQGAPNCTITTTEDVYLGIETGKENPQAAYITGKVKISNLSEMMRYIKSFKPAA